MHTLIHELIHVLGFSGGMISYWKNINNNLLPHIDPLYVGTIRGIQTYVLATPKIKELVRAYYGSSDLIGMQLENQGGSGSMGSHWETTLLFGEIMTA